MSDFMKIFRRQRSAKNTGSDDTSIEREPEQHKSISKRIDQNSNLNNKYDKRMSVASEVPSQNTSISNAAEKEDRFKDTKGWRKSLRKLRWKKRDPVSGSISYDSIDKVGDAASNEHLQEEKVQSPVKPSKRWSYSPDLCEENVPGARELRGNLERKLSVKLEADESQYSSSPRRIGRRVSKPYPDNKVDPQDDMYDVNEESVQHEISTNSQDSEEGNEEYGQSLHASATVPDSLNSTIVSRDLSSMYWLSQSQPIPLIEGQRYDLLGKGNSSPGLVEWGNNGSKMETFQVPVAPPTMPMNGESMSLMQPSMSGHSLDASEDVEAPYDLEDIDDVLANSDSRSNTLRALHGQGLYDALDRDTSTLQALTGSLLRGRALTKYEREAEYALENIDYQNHNYEDAPVEHYYRQLNDVDGKYNGKYVLTDGRQKLSGNRSQTVDGAVGSYVEFQPPTPDDNISWDSNEFDSTSDESDDNNEKREKHRSKSERVQKLRFWEKTSLKKKLSNASSPKPPDMMPVTDEIEQSSFVELNIPADRHPLPQLPTEIPPDLSENQLKRRRIVETVLSSEQSYIESLQRLETDYKQALLDHKPPILAVDMIEKIFYKISAILQCHRMFQIALAVAAKYWDENEAIGGNFVASFSRAMVLECYGDFINNFTTAMDAVRKTCIRKPQFIEFLRERQTGSEDRLNLYALMLKPVQRFPQFIMLVQDLLKHTPPSHPDRLPLQLALTELETLAERLNQRKADNEDASDLRNLLENSNLKLTAHTKDGRLRKLIKQGDVRECKHNEDGLLEKVKDCLLVLTNDMLICCSINNRRPHQRGTSSTYKDMYKLKWRVSLDVVEVTDGSPRPSNQVERETLHSDFIALQQIGRLVGSLQLPHEGISSQIVQKCISDLGIRIRQAEQLATQPEDASFTVRFPGNNRSETITRTLVLLYKARKEEWLEAISRTKLENAPANVDSWFSSDGGDSESTWRAPLFLRSLSAHMSFETLQVQCAYSFMPATHVTLLWLSCAASTVLAVVSVYYITDDRVEKVHVMQVESSVQCMEHWNPSGECFSVWLGMESGCLLEYSADGSYRKLSEVPMPTMSTVMIMKAHKNNLYVGLLDGTLAMYSRPSGSLELHHVSSIVVGTGPLVCLSPVRDKLWGCSGNNVVTIDMETFHTESSRSLLMEGENLVVNLVTRVGSGLWVAFCDECNLNLYHLESLDRLQEINLSRVIRDFVQSLDANERISEQCHITSMWSSHSQLFIGTSSGLLLAMPLPKLADSVPKITGPCKVCRHSLSGPLTFLFAPEFSHQPIRSKSTSSLPVYDANSPPPIPRRDDLDETLVPEKEPDEKTTTSEKRKTSLPSRPTSMSVPPSYRDVPPPPYARHNDASPHLPLRPSELGVSSALENSPRFFSNNKAPENGALYEHMEIQSIESPRKDTFIQWNEKSLRHCPVVLVCGEGYKRFGSRLSKQSATNHGEHNSPTILCWKVVPA